MQTRGRSKALLIATSVYQDPTLRRLRSPESDAKELAKVLGDPLIGGYDVQILSNKDESTITRRVEDFFTDASRNDQLILYISGHGIKDDSGRLYFAAHDTHVERLRTTTMPAASVVDMISSCTARNVIIWLDCCFSGAFSSAFTRLGDANAGVVETFKGRGRIVMTASNSIEYAFEPVNSDPKTITPYASAESRPPTSLFTDAIVRGLRSGDADLDGDGIVDSTELYEYVLDFLRSRTTRQTPQLSSETAGKVFIAAAPPSMRTKRAPQVLPVDVLNAVQSPLAPVRLAIIPRLIELCRGADPQAAAALALLNTLESDPAVAAAVRAARARLLTPKPPLADSASRRMEARRSPQLPAHTAAPGAVTNGGTTPPIAPTRRRMGESGGRTSEKLRRAGRRTAIARLMTPRMVIAGIATSTVIALLLSLSLYGNVYFHGTGSPGAGVNSHDSGSTSHGASVSTTPTASIKSLLGITDKRFDRALSNGGASFGSVAFSQDSILVAAGSTGHIAIWPSSHEGNAKVLATERSAQIQNICFSKKGGLIAASDADGYVDVFDVSTKTLRKEWKPFPKEEIYKISISPDGQYVVASTAYSFRIMDLKSGKQSDALNNHTGSIYRFLFSPDGKTMLEFTSLSNTIAVWNPSTYAKVGTAFASDAVDMVGAGNFSANGEDVSILTESLALTTQPVAKIVVLHIKKGTATWGKALSLPVFSSDSASFTADNTHVLANGSEVYSVSTGKKVASVRLPVPDDENSTPITAYAPDGGKVASVNKSYVLLWNMRS